MKQRLRGIPKQNKWQWKRYGLMAAIALAALALVILYFVLRQSPVFAIFTSKEALQTYIEGFGAKGPAVFFILQILQVIITPIPGNVTTAVGAMAFGFWPAFLLSTAAIVLASLACFGIGRLLGKPLLERILKPATVDKYLHTLAKEKQYMLYVFFFLPFFPDDIICIIAGITAMSWRYFTLATLTARPWGILVSAAVGTGAFNLGITGNLLLIAAILLITYFSLKYGERINEAIVNRAKRNNLLSKWSKRNVKQQKKEKKSPAGLYVLQGTEKRTAGNKAPPDGTA